MNLATAMILYADANINQSDKGSSIINIPDKLQTPALRDVARRRILKTNPDVDSAATKKRKKKRDKQLLISQEQDDAAGFVGKKYRVQDTGYGHLISEHDDENEAKKAANARPYSRVIHAPEWQHVQRVRDMVRRKVVKGM